MQVQQLATPAFLVVKSKFERNCQRMLAICNERGLQLRPNIKTHKSTVLARAQFTGTLDDQGDAQAMRVGTSTLSESEHFLEAGFGDVLYCVPLGGTAKIAKAKQLTERYQGRFSVLVDNSEQVEILAQNGVWSVFVKVKREKPCTETLSSFFFCFAYAPG
jgi:D-serine deaminase-like pyridoxal phosphate-dependent protein